MALEKVRDILKEADQNKTAILAFDAFDYNTIYAAIKGAGAVNKPIIIMLYPSMNKIISLGTFAATVKDIAREVSVPVGLHLDHCSDYDFIITAIREGFTSVMADGSSLPFVDYISFTNSVVKTAKIFDVDVEGELGMVGVAANTDDYFNTDKYTTPEQAQIFASETGVASLAIAIGSAHGVYKEEPKLDIERLKEIDAATSVPLVLHGGSGIPEKQLIEAFKNGINKFNIGTEFFALTAKLSKDFYNDSQLSANPLASYSYIRENLQKYIEDKLVLTTMTCR